MINISNLSVFDSNLYEDIFSHEDMKREWDDKAVVSSWITFQKAIARAQAKFNVIPVQASIDIDREVSIEIIDWELLKERTNAVGMGIQPLVEQVTKLENQNIKDFYHWGLTTQDVLDSSQAIRIKRSLKILKAELLELCDILKDMAINERHTVMVARTNSQDALPTTWGLQVSGYLGEFTSHLIRLNEITPRATKGMFGGAIGNLSSSLGKEGILVRDEALSSLGLEVPHGPWNGSQDNITELLHFFSLVHGTLNRMANDCEIMGRTTIGELKEGRPGKGGSSTMPHKANPRLSNQIQTLCSMGNMYSKGAHDLMNQFDIRAASKRAFSWHILPEGFVTLASSIDKAKTLFTCLEINKVKMKDNFKASRNLIMSEAVMVHLAKKIGRSSSYKLVKEIINKSLETNDHRNLDEILLDSNEIMKNFSPKEIHDACNPLNYLGSNDKLIDEVIKRFESIVK